MEFAACMADALPLRETAARVGVSLYTAWFMRMRVCEVMGRRLLPARGESFEMDGTYFPESMPGNHSRGWFGLGRPAHQTGHDASRAGLGGSVCVLCGVSETGDCFCELADGAEDGPGVALVALRRLPAACSVATDGRRSYAGSLGVSATAKSAERATLSRRRRPRFPAGGATALWPPALPRAAAQGALDRGVVEVRGPDLNLQRRGALGVPGRDRPARDLPSAELREPDRHRDVLCAERGQPPRGVRGPHDCPLSGSPSPSAASASRSFMRYAGPLS